MNKYYQNALKTLLARKEVISLTPTEKQLLDVLKRGNDRDIYRFLEDNPSFNHLILALQGG